MNHLRRILAAVVALAGAVLALATAPAAFAKPAAAARLLHQRRRDRPGDRHHRGRHDRLADHPDRGRRCPGRGRLALLLDRSVAARKTHPATT